MRTILATIGLSLTLTLATAVVVVFVLQVQRVLVWMLIAVGFTVALYPAVNWLENRVRWCRRSPATLVVFLVVFLAFGGVLTLFALPPAEQGTQLAARLPDMIADARGGRGPVGTPLERTNALEFVRANEDASGGSPPASVRPRRTCCAVRSPGSSRPSPSSCWPTSRCCKASK